MTRKSKDSSTLTSAVRLSVGTFTAIPVRPPACVNRTTAGLALVLAPLAVLPVGLAVGLVAYAGREMALPAIVVGALAVGMGVLGTRGFHLDGLADTVDALASSPDRARALAVARTGDVGPAGATALALVLLIQAGAAGAVAFASWGPLWIGIAWCLARAAATVGARRGVPAAHANGLGRSFAESLPPFVPPIVWMAVVGVVVVQGLQVGNFAALIGAVLASGATRQLVDHSVKRFGGLIGDVLGACIEISCAILLVGLAAASASL